MDIEEFDDWWNEESPFDDKVKRESLKMGEFECGISLNNFSGDNAPIRVNRYGMYLPKHYSDESTLKFDRIEDKTFFVSQFDLFDYKTNQKKSIIIEDYDKKGFSLKRVYLYGVIPVSYSMDDNDVNIRYDYFVINTD